MTLIDTILKSFTHRIFGFGGSGVGSLRLAFHIFQVHVTKPTVLIFTLTELLCGTPCNKKQKQNY